MFGMGGGGGAAAAGDVTSGLLTAGDCGAGDSMADIGRGGAIVPNRMDASCLALPPLGRSSSSSDESSDDSTTDQSSSSFGAARVRAGAADGSGRAVLFCSVVMRWNGLVDWASAGCGEAIAELAGG